VMRAELRAWRSLTPSESAKADVRLLGKKIRQRQEVMRAVN
jgi:hypothetical protein